MNETCFYINFTSSPGSVNIVRGPFNGEIFQTEAHSGIERGIYRSTKNFQKYNFFRKREKSFSISCCILILYRKTNSVMQ